MSEKPEQPTTDSSQKTPLSNRIKKRFADRAAFKKEQKSIEKSRERSLKYLLLDDKARQAEPKEAPKDALISLRHVNKVYPNLVQAVYDFNLDIKEKEFIVFVGPSGCGKSTTLRMIAGLEDITTGNLFLEGKRANELPAKDRDMAMVFQSYALYPHLNVYQNMAFSLKLRHVDKDTIYQRVKAAAKILELGEYLDRKPKELSGGQRQRVALGRAIVRNAKVFLMDEPLSNLDAKLRVQMRSEIVKLHRSLEATTIYVTHDQTEAMTMADRIVVMKLGHVQQIGTPEEIFDHPANMFVASFIGSPAMNLIPAVIEGNDFRFSDGKTLPSTAKQIKQIEEFHKNRLAQLEQRLAVEEQRVAADIAEAEAKHKKKKVDLSYIGREAEEMKKEIAELQAFISEPTRRVVYGIRPEDFSRANKDSKVTLEVEIGVAELMGREYIVHFNLGGKDAVARIDASQPVSQGDKLKLAIDTSKARIYDPLSTLSIGN